MKEVTKAIWTDEKAEVRRRKEVRRSEKRKREKKEDAGRDSLCFSNDLWLKKVEK